MAGTTNNCRFLAALGMTMNFVAGGTPALLDFVAFFEFRNDAEIFERGGIAFHVAVCR